MSASYSTNEQAFEQEGLARLTTLLKAVPFVKSVKVEPQPGDHGWDAEVAVQTTTGVVRLLVVCKRQGEPRFLREAVAQFELARIKRPQACSFSRSVSFA